MSSLPPTSCTEHSRVQHLLSQQGREAELPPPGERMRDLGDGPERLCTHCREWWPADEEFFFKATGGKGLHIWCKACCSDSRLERYRRTRDAARAQALEPTR